MWAPEPTEDADHPQKIAAMEEGIPLYEVAGLPEGVECLLGTDYPKPSKKGVYKLLVQVGFREDPKNIPVRVLMRELRRFLAKQVVANAYTDAMQRLASETPDQLPGQHPRHEREAVLFWFYPPVSSNLGSAEGQPSLAIRTKFSETNRAAIKSAIRSPGYSTGGWLPDPWKLWVVRDMTTAATVLSSLRQSFTFRWVMRAGFPGAPPLP